jgi:hypothetical protein
MMHLHIVPRITSRGAADHASTHDQVNDAKLKSPLRTALGIVLAEAGLIRRRHPVCVPRLGLSPVLQPLPWHKRALATHLRVSTDGTFRRRGVFVADYEIDAA